MSVFLLHKKKLYQAALLAAAFFIPALMLLRIYAGMGLAPFGERSVLVADMTGQYVTFFAALRDIAAGDSSIFFSWSKSFGSSFIGVFAYYIASPLSCFTLLFSAEELPVALMFLTCIKTGLAGLSLAVYFKYAFRRCTLFTLLLSVCYALMSYASVYSPCIMWLDGLIWLPIILLGMEKLLAGKLPWLLTAGLGVMFIANYYIAYMIGIFCVLYFVVRFLEVRRCLRDWLQPAFRMGAAVLLAAGLAAWLVLPVGFDLSTGKFADTGLEMSGGLYFMPADLLRKLLPGQYDGIVNGLPSIYCGSVVTILVIVFFLNRNVPRREKILGFAGLSFMVLGFCSRSLNSMWHGFQYPNWFPYRNAFLFSFFMIFLAFRGGIRLRQNNRSRMLTVHMAAAHITAVHIAAVHIAAGVGVTVLLLLQTAELSMNTAALLAGLDAEYSYGSITEYRDSFREIQPLVEFAEQAEGFTRLEKDFEWTKNDALTFGYKGVTHYSSSYNARLNEFTRQIGLGQDWYWNSYYGNTILDDMLFDMKHIMSRREMPAWYRPVAQSGDISLYQNPRVLPIGFMAADVSPVKGSVFEAQNQILNRLTGWDELYFRHCEFEKLGSNLFGFTAPRKAPYYLYIPAEKADGGSILVNGKFRGDYFTGETICCLFIGDFEAGDSVTIQIDSDTEVNRLEICALDTEQLIRAWEHLNKGGLTVENYGADEISGNVYAAGGGVMMTTIPYDAGFLVEVDGERVDIGTAFDTFLSFKVPQGRHEIRMKYYARGQIPGAVISGLSLFAAVLIIIFNRRRYFRRYFAIESESDPPEFIPTKKAS